MRVDFFTHSLYFIFKKTLKLHTICLVLLQNAIRSVRRNKGVDQSIYDDCHDVCDVHGEFVLLHAGGGGGIGRICGYKKSALFLLGDVVPEARLHVLKAVVAREVRQVQLQILFISLDPCHHSTKTSDKNIDIS